jgi:hypothetical protein
VGTFFVFLVIILVAGWAIFVQIGARQRIDVTTQLTEQDAGDVVSNHFGVSWTLVDGPGHLNYLPKLRMQAPVISISFSPDGTRECGVSIWTSSWQTKYGVMAEAQLAWRKKQALASRVRNAAAVDNNWTSGA